MDGKVLGNLSGLGKNTLTLYDTILSLPRSISVSVWQNQDIELAESSVTLSPISPLVIAYEDSPLYGFLFNRAVSSMYPMRESEITLTAFPFFFSADSRLSPGVTYSWKMTGGVASNLNSVTYRSPEKNGSASINLVARSVNNLLQTAASNFLIEFKKQ